MAVVAGLPTVASPLPSTQMGHIEPFWLLIYAERTAHLHNGAQPRETDALSVALPRCETALAQRIGFFPNNLCLLERSL